MRNDVKMLVCNYSFLHVTRLGPDVGDHISHAVAANRVLEHVRELRLTELNERLARVR